MLGFYDSGIGGLSVFKRVVKTFNKTDVHYFADSEFFPMGEKSKQEITERVKKAVEFLFNKGCNGVILACNTASVNTIPEIYDWLAKNYPDKYIFDIATGCVDFMNNNYSQYKNQTGLLLATESTIKSNYYQNNFNQLGFTKMQYIAAPGLTKAIENKDNVYLKQTIYDLTKQTNDISNLKYILLACTHYPLAIGKLIRFFGTVDYIDPAFQVAKNLSKIYLRYPTIFGVDTKDFFWTTGDTKNFNSQVQSAIGWKVDSKKVEL